MKVIYTNFLPKGTGGMALGPLVLIRPKYKEDQGIHAHEQDHVNDWRADPWGFHRKYLLDQEYRLAAEVAAYKIQIEVTMAQHKRTDQQYQDYLVQLFAGFIADRYRLEVTKNKAAELLLAALINS